MDYSAINSGNSVNRGVQPSNSWRETTPLIPVQEDGSAASAPAAVASVPSSQQSSGWSVGGVLYYACLGLVLLGGITSVIFAFVRSGKGKVPIASDFGVPFVTAAHPLRPTALWGKLEAPYPTGAWFTNMVLDAGDNPVVPLPYAVSITDKGVGASFSALRRRVTSKRLLDTFDADLILGADEAYMGHTLTAYDNLTATVNFALKGVSSYQTYLVRGSPYITNDYLDATPTVSTNVLILTVNGQPVKKGMTVRGNQFKLGLSNWETWLVYTSESVSFKVDEKSMRATVPVSGIVRAAMLPRGGDAEMEAVLTEHAHAYAKGSTIRFSVSGDTLKTTFQWDKAGFGDLLLLALPHHIDMMNKDDVQLVLPSSYQTMKGKMTGVVGASWELHEQLTTVQWGAPVQLDPASLQTGGRLHELKSALARDIAGEHPVAPDVYGFGKQAARMARLALIADELGETEYREQALGLVEGAITPWLRNDNKDLLIYDKSWGQLVTYDGLNDVNADFGNAWGNDHHFMYGYMLYSAAVVIKFRPSFYTTYRRQLDYMLADIACRKQLSDKFPFARHKDWFDGHSWASGLFPQANGKSQESSSEAVNAYYAVYLMGVATGSAETRDWGRILLAGEIRSTKKYWQMKSDTDVYDSVFAANKMVGVVGGLDAVALTWFGPNVEYVHCINMMPFTPITEELLSYDYMQEEWPVLATAFDRKEQPVPQWAGYMHMAHAILEPDAAWDALTALNVYDSGNSKTNALYWVATRPRTTAPYNVTAFAEAAAAAAVDIPSSCLANSACFAQGLTLECCPVEEGGVMLLCCPTVAPSGDDAMSEAACSAHPRCVAQGLAGSSDADNAAAGTGEVALCCPTLSGAKLECCDSSTPAAAAAGTSSASDAPELCANNAGCEGLEGNCCPTDNGTFLGCCPPPSSSSAAGASDSKAAAEGDSTERKSKKHHAQSDNSTGGAECSNFAACAGLEGLCCPTSAGDMLGCCTE